MSTTTTYDTLVGDYDLNITSIYTDLMKASTGRGSAYIKAKETIAEYAKTSNLTEIEKATLVSQTVTQLAQNVTNEAMQIAFKIAQENRDAPFALAKLKADTTLVAAQVKHTDKSTDSIDKDLEIKATQVKKGQAELYRDYGLNYSKLLTTTSLEGASTDFLDYGSKAEAIKMAQANRYNTYATSYRQNGVVNVVLGTSTSSEEEGFLTSSTSEPDNGAYRGLLTQQYNVAVRQEAAFEDNKRQHAANASSSMISMLLSTDSNSISAADLAGYIGNWNTAMNSLLTDTLG